ncbi:hypothetical protein [Sagittula sp. SSi028]|uniref:hypothetical protein n=1 Tax=Sagittula sp. SSi028 TaxID=3400636 RepID=UPI003AF5C6E5
MPVLGSNVIAGTVGLSFMGALVVGAQFLPPLTQPDPVAFPEFSQFRALTGDNAGLVEARSGSGRGAIIDPGRFCRDTMRGVDCGCFRDAAIEVLSGGQRRAAGWQYANDWQLAQVQAEQSCR